MRLKRLTVLNPRHGSEGSFKSIIGPDEEFTRLRTILIWKNPCSFASA